MQFQLRDPDKVGFIIVAGKTFTYDEPGPHEIDVESLPLDQRNQLLYSFFRMNQKINSLIRYFGRILIYCGASWRNEE